MSVGDAASVVSTIYGILSPPILRQCGYILFCKSHANDLKDEIQKLKDVAARVQHSVDESRSAGDQFIQEDVLTWLKKADERIELGTRLLETNKVGRVLGCVPDPKACHKLGRNSKKAIQDVQKICSEGQNLKNVSYHRVEEQSLIVGAATSSKRKYVELKSRTAVLKFVMEALDDDKIGTIGVYGMGGVGKTTLLKEVENEAKESKKFDGVVSVFVSQTPNLTAISAEIDYRLKRLGYDESRKTVLILFDDLWKPLNLKDVGVPESNNKLKVKLVMTSRNKHLLANEMSCQRAFSIGVLDVEEAWRFFAVLVGSNVEDLKRKPAAVEFLKKCGGLPVSIEALAKFWKKKKMDLTFGDLNEDELKHVKESPDGFVSLEMSYNSLEDGDEGNLAKLVFRTIGLLNAPTVPVLTLIKYMVGLGKFGSSTSYNIVERARMEITRSLRTLQDASLLLESEDSDHVKIHDVVRDVAVRIASREDHALIFDPLKGVKEWSKKKLDKCRAHTLTSSALLELRKKRWNSPDLNILVLEAGAQQGDHDLSRQKEGRGQVELPNSSSKGDQHVELPDALFKHTVKLRVLHLKNARFTSLPSSINSELQNLTTLCLDNCCLENIAAIGKLVTLQALSIIGSDLAKLPEEIGELTNLRMLDLSKCSQLVFIEPGILKRLTQLEELYLKESFDKWETEGDGGKMNASLEELNSIPRLRTLEVRIPDTSKLPRNLPIADLVQCKVIMGESWDWSGEYTRTLKLEVKSNSMINEEWFQSALQKTQDLHLEGLNNGTMESFHELCREGFEELKHLHLQNSSSIECIIWSTEWLECSAFTVLESMVLEKMGSLEKICNGRINLSSFSKLKVVRVQECHKLRSIFNLSLLKNLIKLEEIEISDCDMVQQIVIGEQVDDETVEEQSCWGRGCSNILFGRPTKRQTTDAEEGATAADNEIVMLLGNLRYLTLRNLPEITSFFTTEGGPSDQTMETSVAQTSAVDDADDDGGDGDGATGEEQQSVGMNGAGAGGAGGGDDDDDNGDDGDDDDGDDDDDTAEQLDDDDETSMAPVTAEQVYDDADDDGGGGGGGGGGDAAVSFNDQKTLAVDDVDDATGEKQRSVGMNSAGASGGGDDGGGATGEEQQSVGMNGCSNILFGRGEGVIRPWRRKITSFFTAEGGPSESSMEANVAAVFFNDQKVSKPPKYKEIQSTTRLRLDKLQRVELIDCKNVVHFTNSQVLLKLVNLESLTIEGCESLEDIFDLEGIKPKSGNVEILPKLYELKLRDLPKLEHIWKNNRMEIKGCQKLRTVEIYQCDNLRYFSSSFMCKVMENLTEINIGNCKEIETIFREEEGQESNGSSVKVQLKSLKILAVSECRKLKTFLSTNSRRNKGMAYWCYGKKAVDTSISFFNEKVFLPSFESVILSNAGEFEKIWCGEIPPGHESYCKLEYLHVEYCDNLRSVIPASMIERLHNLKQLWVMECRRLEVVFDIDVRWKIEKKSKDLMLPQLQEVKLERLESLTHVMKRGSNDDEIVVGFPSLNRLKVNGCGSLINNVISTTTATTLLELKSLDISHCSKLQKVIGGEVSGRYKRNVITLPHLTSLKLSSLDSLTYFSSESHRFDFKCLKVLKIECCGSLKALIKPRSDGCPGSEDADQTNSATQVLFNEKIQLPNLEELHIAECNSLQDICKTTSTKQIESSRDSVIVFTRLTSLELGGGIQLSHLLSGRYTLEIPFLKKLLCRRTNPKSLEAFMEKVYLPNLEELVVSSSDIAELWQNEPLAGSFSKLKRLEVEKCHQLQRLIPSCMVKNLQNLEMLVVKRCYTLKTMCELRDDDVDDREGSKLAFSPFQNLASLHVEFCGCERLFDITSRQFEETSDHKIMQLPQLAYLTLNYLRYLNHLFDLPEGGQKYALELPSLKEFLLIIVGDEEAVTHEVTFPEEVKIQYRLSEDVSNFFGSITGVVTDVVKALKTNQVIIGLFGDMDAELKQAVKEEAANLFDQVLECRGGAGNIQDGLREVLSISYGEAEVQRRAQRLRKTLLNYIRNKRLLLIISVDDFAEEEDIMMLEAAGIPRDGFNPKHFKIILVSKDKELLLKMGAHQLPIIPIGRYLGSRWKILKPQRIEVFQTRGDKHIIGMHGRTRDTENLLMDVVSLVQRDNLCDILVEPDDNEVDTIQEKLKTALGITSCETGLHECIRQSLLSNRNKRLIVVLRDLDQEVDLEAVGIPPLHDGLLDPNYFKINLTSENEEVLQKMGAQKTLEVKSAESIESDNPFIRVQDGYAELRKLADECGSDILAVGLALKLKDQGMDAWKNAFQRLKEAPFEYKEREKVIDSLPW